MLHRVCFALPASIYSQLPRLTLCSVLRCLFVCLLACDWPLQNTPSMARPTPHARRRAVMAFSRCAAQECVAAVRALVGCRQPAEPLPHKRTAPVRMRRVPPKRR
jgi:hypothetical protein